MNTEAWAWADLLDSESDKWQELEEAEEEQEEGE